jgi:Tol biopolymer transport system component
VFVSNEGGNANIWITNPEDNDGSDRKQLTANGAMNFSPVVTPDGKYIVFSAWRDGKKALWRMNLDGSNPVQLTFGIVDAFPSVTPDSRWVIYTAPHESRPTLWKVSIDGGTPARIMDHVAAMGMISPDGKYLAYTYPESIDPAAPVNRLAIMTADGTQTLNTFHVRASGTVLSMIQWSHDSKSVFYTITANNITNLWSQPIDGDPAKQVTDFKDMLITSFAWSPDGKRLACTRGNLIRDAVLIQDLGRKEAQKTP